VPQNWSPDGTRQERTGWRDAEVSARHRHWGMNCPAVDLDFLMVEYNLGKPVALVEYKHHYARTPNLLHPTYRAIRMLADGYRDDPLPFIVAFYWSDIWAFRIVPVNEVAERHFKFNEHVSEREFVSRLYRMRRLVLAAHLKDSLHTELPAEAAESHT
jgi:hypothetical protein